jgi:hypothetical protein
MQSKSRRKPLGMTISLHARDLGQILRLEGPCMRHLEFGWNPKWQAMHRVRIENVSSGTKLFEAKPVIELTCGAFVECLWRPPRCQHGSTVGAWLRLCKEVGASSKDFSLFLRLYPFRECIRHGHSDLEAIPILMRTDWTQAPSRPRVSGRRFGVPLPTSFEH